VAWPPLSFERPLCYVPKIPELLVVLQVLATVTASSFLANFNGYWRRSPEDYKFAVENYTIVLDANVLLELYRFTRQAREELIKILEQLQERVWVPHQAAAEYYLHRSDAIRDHLRLYASVPENLDSYRDKVIAEVSSFARRCSLSDEQRRNLAAPIDEAFRVVAQSIGEYAAAFDLTLDSVVQEDPVLQALSRILDGRVGDAFTEADSVALIEEYKCRAAAEVPPGYKDVRKSENAYGDYFIWEQTLRMASSSSKGVLLVTNDLKDDWVRRQAGFVVGARPELIAEMEDRAHVDFMITHLGAFLKTAKDVVGSPVSESTVAQAENSEIGVPEALFLNFPEEIYCKVIEQMRENISREEQVLEELLARHRASPEQSLDNRILAGQIGSARMATNAAVSDLATFSSSIQPGPRDGWLTFSTSDKYILDHVKRIVAMLESEEAAVRERVRKVRQSGKQFPHFGDMKKNLERLLVVLSARFDDVEVLSVGSDSISLSVRDFPQDEAASLHGIAMSFNVDIAIIDSAGVVHRFWAR
jgi:hypothetical protein